MDELTEYAIQRAEKDIIKQTKPQLVELQQSARFFLNSVRDAISITDDLQSEIKRKIQDANKITINTIYKAMKQSTFLTQKIVEAQYIFESKLNKFLHRTIALIWVDQETGQLFYADEATAQEIYKTGTKKNDGRAGVRINKDNLKTFDDFRDTLGDFGKRIKQHQQNYKSLFDEVSRRWEKNNDPTNPWYNISQAKKGKIGGVRYPYRTTFYWWDNGWQHSKKMNKGNISQAYVHIIMNENPGISSGTGQLSVKGYWTYMQNHSILNNVPGIVQGDVSLVGNEMLQFAVKEGNFNTASVGPYLTTAYLILALSDQIQVQTILDNLSKLGQKIRSRADILAQKEVSDKIKESLLNAVLT